MSRPNPIPSRGFPRNLSQDYQLPRAAPARSRGCKVDLVMGSGPCFTSEITCLLRFRLRFAYLFALTGSGFFLIRNLLGQAWLTTGGFEQIFLGLVVATLAGIAVLLWSRLALSLNTLRVLELVPFAALGGFFAYLQVLELEPGKFFAFDGTPREGMLLRLAAGAVALRWFILLVVYGSFIPNTWQRSAAVAAVMAATPLLLTVAAGVWQGNLGPLARFALPDLAIVMLMGWAIAVFGSYKIHALQHEAYEARQIGQYRLKQRLGAGGMGEVFLGEHVLLRRPCAIKIIRPEQAGDPTNLQRFEREVRATATLTHWNTVEIYDYGHTGDGTFYYVMEYLPGMSLQDLVEKHGPLPPERAVHFLRQACAALREAHAIGLVHRDIKPSNILACERGGVRDVAKLVDFGLVQRTGLGDGAERLTLQGAIVGSPPYMAPEQAAGQALDVRGDLYSLGAVGYFLLTGQPPFVRDNALQMLLAHAHDPVTPPSQVRPGIPDDLEQVILRCLEKDPERRFPDAASLDKALARCASAGKWTEEEAIAWWQGRPQTSPDAANGVTTVAFQPAAV